MRLPAGPGAAPGRGGGASSASPTMDQGCKASARRGVKAAHQILFDAGRHVPSNRDGAAAGQCRRRGRWGRWGFNRQGVTPQHGVHELYGMNNLKASLTPSLPMPQRQPRYGTLATSAALGQQLGARWPQPDLQEGERWRLVGPSGTGKIKPCLRILRWPCCLHSEGELAGSTESPAAPAASTRAPAARCAPGCSRTRRLLRFAHGGAERRLSASIATCRLPRTRDFAPGRSEGPWQALGSARHRKGQGYPESVSGGMQKTGAASLGP